jgi:ATP-dependent Clp protease adaptor protein ClpS|tara:strand:- start:74 stop:373 length:300 start_codon:yes stop_codon:yes gene_type:complete
MSKQQTKTKVRTELRYPSNYNVIIFNDDFTPMDFVIRILVEIFNKNLNTAKDQTMLVHNKGSAIAGTYNHEIADQKCTEAIAISRASGHPLQLKVERVE